MHFFTSSNVSSLILKLKYNLEVSFYIVFEIKTLKYGHFCKN